MKKLVTASKEKQVELSPIHDFAAKLRQPAVLQRLKDYVRWQAAWRKARAEGQPIENLLSSAPDQAPMSINLDITTACNYACDHCVDFDILNTGVRYDQQKLLDSLTHMVEHGLRSVIIIGGGEPTLDPGFEEVVRHLKTLKVSVGVVTNGSMLKKILAVADVLEKDDWVRLSLDSGANDTFVRMHKPKKKSITLEWICEQIAPIKEANPNFNLGFSFVIVWKDCQANDYEIVENLEEIEMATELAKKSKFDYISFKPFLNRAESNNAEVVGITQTEDRVDPIMAQIRERVDRAKQLGSDGFRVIESTNLKVLENGTYMNYTAQPKNCHMQVFRQVLSPLGIFNCPVYRHVEQAKIGEKHSYSTEDELVATQKNTYKLIEEFDARKECKDVTCLYNHVNWYLEDLIDNPEKLDALEASPDRNDYFL